MWIFQKQDEIIDIKGIQELDAFQGHNLPEKTKIDGRWDSPIEEKIETG